MTVPSDIKIPVKVRRASDLASGLTAFIPTMGYADAGLTEVISGGSITNTGSPSHADDASRGRVVVLGGSAYLTGTGNEAMASAWSIFGWFKTSTSGTMDLFGSYQGTLGGHIEVYMNGGMAIYVNPMPGGGDAGTTGTAFAVNDGAWHWYCATRSGATLKLNVDGTETTSAAMGTGGTEPAGATWTLGCAPYSAGLQKFTGSIGPHYIYSSVISPTTLAALVANEWDVYQRTESADYTTDYPIL